MMGFDMRHSIRLVAILAMAVSIASGAGRLEDKILRVEKGLVRAVVPKGRPAPKFTIAERLRHHRIPGVSVAVVSRGEVEWVRGYGLASVDDAKPVTVETLFQAASISKPVAAMVALRLVELGRLSLDEDINLKLKSWKVPESDLTKTEKVTLRRLLSHTAGLTVHGFPGYDAGAPVPTLRQVLDGVKPANTMPIRPDIAPGSLHRYSGGGYEVMQQLIEDVAGKPFPQVARELVLDPLGMKRSTYDQPLPEPLAATAASGYRGDGAIVKGKWHTYPEMAAAGLWTTPSDLARVILELQKPAKVLRPETVNAMLTPVLGRYGLGLGTEEKDGRKSFSHGGANEGFRCMLFGYRGLDGGAVVMTNGDRGGTLAREILSSIAMEYGWPDFRPEEKQVVEVSPEVLRSYAGRYQLRRGPPIVVTVGDGRLHVMPRPGVSFELLPESEDSFFDPDRNMPDVRFLKKPDGAVEMSVSGTIATRL
jgi:CubicO group peptidase (beta-lactamase class C family)